MQRNDNPKIKFDKTFFKWILNASCQDAGLEKSVFGKCTRGRIVMSIVANIAGIGNVLSIIFTTMRNCVALDYAKLEQQIQAGHFRDIL